jgi:hypothetical protein
MEHQMSTIEAKNGHVPANAESRVENENQKHSYSEDASAGHLTGEFEHKGEDVKRTEKASTATLGRHLTSMKTGLEVAKERSAHVKANRDASAKLFDSKKLTVCPEQKKGRK